MKFANSQVSSVRSNFGSVVAVLALLFAMTIPTLASAASKDSAKDPSKDEAKESDKKAKIVVSDDGSCQEAIDETAKACNTPDMIAGLSAAQQSQAAALQAQANQSNQAVSTAGANQAAQCQNQADMSKIMAALSALKGGACMYTVTSCKSACESDLDQLKVILANAESDDKAMVQAKIKKKQKQISKCEESAPNAGVAMAQAALMVGSMFMNQSCAQQNVAGAATPVSTDCTNPDVARTSILCICQADPKNRMCSPSQLMPGSTITTTGAGGAAGPAFKSDFANDGAPVTGAVGKPNTASGSSVSGAGAGGGPAAANGAPLAAGPNSDAGGRSDIDKGVITGVSGSSNRAGGLAVNGGGGGGGGGSAGGGRAPNNSSAFDLSKYLPKGATIHRPGRLPSGKDGITSSMGPSLWEKVSVQYQSQKLNLIQDK